MLVIAWLFFGILAKCEFHPASAPWLVSSASLSFLDKVGKNPENLKLGFLAHVGRLSGEDEDDELINNAWNILRRESRKT